MNLEEILDCLSVYDGKYKRECMEAALQHQEEITPRLLGLLDEVLAQPEAYAERENYHGHFYAVILLAYFKETRAHQRIIDLFSFPYELTEALFGDMKTETLPALLYQTCGGNFDRIRAMISNLEADEFCRSSAAGALGFGVADGQLTRKETLDFLTGFLKHQETGPLSNFPGLIANTLYDLYPDGYMEVIESAYKKGMIDSFMIRLEDFQERLDLGLESALQKLRADYKRRILDDVHGYLESWACFRRDERGIDIFDHARSRSSPLEARLNPDWNPGDTPSPRSRTPKEAHKDKKRKRKMARSSRRKNRKRKRK
ncbi:MAG: DUF1186 domain-containing protein [Gammaproteobacteria bacterium]|nr:DUF1186 domain-containing protein [Gammaproteobacteria bacterium]